MLTDHLLFPPHPPGPPGPPHTRAILVRGGQVSGTDGVFIYTFGVVPGGGGVTVDHLIIKGDGSLIKKNGQTAAGVFVYHDAPGDVYVYLTLDVLRETAFAHRWHGRLAGPVIQTIACGGPGALAVVVLSSILWM